MSSIAEIERAITKLPATDLERLRRWLEQVPTVDFSRERFRSLAAAWKAETRFLSDTNEICSHPAYQQIIGMGTAALPHILAELENEPDHWFWALRAITGVNPVAAEHSGSLKKMACDWLDWARSEKTRTESAS